MAGSCRSCWASLAREQGVGLLAELEDLLNCLKCPQRCWGKPIPRNRMMRLDKSGRINAVSLPEGIARTGIKTGSFVDFKVEMGEPGIIPGSHRSQLLAPRKDRARSHGDLVQVAIEAVNPSPIRKAVPKDHHLPPFPAPVPGKDNLPVAHRVNRISKIGISSSDTIQVLAQMIHLCPVVPHEKWLGIVGKSTRFGAKGLLENDHGRKKKPGKGIVQHKAPVESRNPSF